MTPEELEKLPKPLERTMTALELSIMDEIIQRIKEAARVTPVIDWLLVRMDAIGVGRARIKQLIGEGIRKAGLQVDDIYEQAAKSESSALANGTLKYPNSNRSAPSSSSSGTSSDHLSMELTTTSLPRL